MGFFSDSAWQFLHIGHHLHMRRQCKWPVLSPLRTQSHEWGFLFSYSGSPLTSVCVLCSYPPPPQFSQIQLEMALSKSFVISDSKKKCSQNPFRLYHVNGIFYLLELKVSMSWLVHISIKSTPRNHLSEFGVCLVSHLLVHLQWAVRAHIYWRK